MQTKESDLRIVNLRLLSFNLRSEVPETPSEGRPTPEHGSPEIDFRIERNDQKDIYRIIVEVSAKAQEAGYSYDVSAVGFFALRDDTDPERRDPLLLNSALPMVLSAIRGYLADMTAHSVYGRYMLPTIDMPDLLSQWNDELKQEDQD